MRLQKKNVGTTLGNTRVVKLAAYQDGRVLAGPDLADILKQGQRITAMPGLAADKHGRLWLRFRHRQRDARPRQNRRYWTEKVTFLSNSGWQEPIEMPTSTGRITVFSRQQPAQDGGENLLGLFKGF